MKMKEKGIMKKWLLTLCVALLSLGAQAQERGDFAVGVRGGIDIVRFDFGKWSDTSTRFGIGAFGQYNLSKHFRLDLEGIYHPKNDHVSDFQLGLDVQYLIHISDKFKIYPQIGYGFAFVKEDTYTTTNGQSSITVEGGNKTDGGFQIGAGLQYNLGENWFIGADYRFQPAILGRVHVIMASVGYRF
jgi:outer membrane protein X